MNWIATDNVNIPPDASNDYKYAAGIDYLEGNDCAVRHKKAIALLQEAANAGHEEAMRTLAELHHREIGLGLTPDGEIYWLNKLVDLAEERYYAEYHREFGDTCCRYMEQLFTALFSHDKLADAQELGERWHRLATDMEERYLSLVPLATAELRLSDLFYYMGQSEMALMYCRNVYDRLLPHCDEYAASLAVLVCGAAERLFNLMFILSIPGDSDPHKQNAERLEAELVKNTDAGREYYPFQLKKMRITFPMRSDAEDRKGIWLEQKHFYSNAIQAQEKYMLEADTPSAKDAFAEKCMEYANVCKHTSDPQEAYDYYKKAYDLWKELFDRRPRAQYQVLMAQCLQLQIPILLRQFNYTQAKRNAYLACSMVTQLRDPELTQHAKEMLAENYRQIYEALMQSLLLEAAQEIVCKLALLEKEAKDGDAAGMVYLRHLSNLTKKGDGYAEGRQYSYAISCYGAGILFAEYFRNQAPLLSLKHANSLQVILSGSVIGLYKRLGGVEAKLGNKNAARECHRMARYIRDHSLK